MKLTIVLALMSLIASSSPIINQGIFCQGVNRDTINKYIRIDDKTYKNKLPWMQREKDKDETETKNNESVDTTLNTESVPSLTTKDTISSSPTGLINTY